MKIILMDVEGTTTSISFVHEVLFPFSEKHLEQFINKNFENNLVQEVLLDTFNTVFEEEKLILKHIELIKKLKQWIAEDRKHPALKKLQGAIWNEGYLSGELKGHLYPEVPEVLSAWKNSGLTLAVYSSGSIDAQKLLFSHSVAGDLSSLFSYNFDTGVGHKREASSYQNILKTLNVEASEVLFLSDISQELDAAEIAGMKTIQLVRLEDVPFTGHIQVKNFKDIKI